jgi:hypothetical protein
MDYDDAPQNLTDGELEGVAGGVGAPGGGAPAGTDGTPGGGPALAVPMLPALVVATPFYPATPPA